MTDTSDRDPSPINSSYAVLFHAAILFVAPLMVAVFPGELHRDALMIAVVFPVTLFWFSYLVRQFMAVSTMMRVILGAAFVVAALSLLNAVYGHLSDGSVPVVYTQVPFFAALLAGLSGPIGLVYAGTVLAYGAYVYIICVALASLAEGIYEHAVRRRLPQGFRRTLRFADASIDRSAARVSDQFFVFNQAIGVGICLALIAVYAVLYLCLLVK